MSTQLLIAFAIGLAIGAATMAISEPHQAIAQSATGTPGLYQLQSAPSIQPGVSMVWRVNTATGTLDLCTYANVIPTGSSHINCQGNTAGPK